MATRLRILIVEDSEDDAVLTVRALRRGGLDPIVERVDTAPAMEAALEKPWDVVIADYALPQFSALAALQLVKSRTLDLPFLIVSGTIGEETAVAAMKAGAHDYLMKGNLTRLVPAIQRELREAEDRRARGAAEAALDRERKYSRLLVDGANALIVGLDLEGRVTLLNKAAEAVTGYSREDLAGQDWFARVVPRERYPAAWQAFVDFRSSGRPEEMETPILGAAGEERIVAWRNSLLRDGNAVLGVMAFGIDVTERKRAERERTALEQVARRAEKLAALGTLSAGLAHELNNPIGIISARIEVMLMEAGSTGLPNVVRDDLTVLHRNAQRVAQIATGLLSFSRQSPAERAPVRLGDVVRETLLLAGKQMSRDGIRLTLDLDDALPVIMGDANALQQVVLNLLTNARDALPAGGDIRIETHGVADRLDAVCLTVQDTGHGIAPDDLARIFDPFFSRKPRGTGLGLSISDGIVREHGGTIDVESELGRGTRFVLTFPAAGDACG